MDAKRAFRWSGYYFGLTVVAAVVGFALVAVGAALGIYAGYEVYATGSSVSAALSTAAPGIVAAFVGIAIWRFGKAWAFYKTLTGAMDDELADTYDTEHVKADILSVLDERLTDMQQDIQSMNRNVRELKKGEQEAESGFEFNG
ncbi:MAG TPA: hypothetical protein VKA37_12155 [Halobacteriales archaeon]|nr:hypothetical protein [Halobacteriales archaeon]